MRKIIFVLLAIVMIFSLTACRATENETLSTREILSEMNYDDIMEYIVEEVPLEDMISYYGEEGLDSYMFENQGYPDMYLIVDELESQGFYDEINELYEMADKIGYYPSAILGEYFLDKSTSIIHSTDGDCLNYMSIEDRQVVCCGSAELRNELEDGDNYLRGCTLCDICIGEKAL